MDLESKSVKELRELAKRKGLTNYSKLTKEKLIRLLAKPAATAGKKAGSNKKGPRKQAPAADSPSPPRAPEPAERVDADEILVEEAKYVLTPPGIPEAVHAEGPDLGEDIETLPPITEPLLCLLPQKPGILHAYWVVDPQTLQRKEGLRLRLTRLADQSVELLQEFEVNAANGHWYMHLPETEDPGEVYLQFGHYTPEGQFVTALQRGTVRVPTLGAAGGVDPRWWFSDEQFREMYLRAGGYVRGTRLGWAGPAASSR